ncbi:hypothetical protein JAAARDRAFT_49197 [Jaapia argillacea MUCL 33604]|uniref:Uncharacterized protein n=1 Tax=Jaapia argillacea MUCL 33604 TaxID=933084 RepID=A0A067PTG2_9AGAM|nr:hypothetical protein JAAARDRAFT_49197 [Jaapia argillacea MUCL 33604]
MPTLNVTAIAAVNGSSVFQCWALEPPFVTSSQAGTIGASSMQLGNLANASYSIIPGNFSAGRHNAPAVQYVVFLSGLAHVTLPNSTADAWVPGGSNGLLVAADVASVSTYGHITTYPSPFETIALQIPTAGGIVPNHTVLHDGACPLSPELKRSLEGLD